MANETYVFVVSSHDPISEETLDRIVAEESELSSWHRSAYVPPGKFVLVAEGKLSVHEKALAHV